MLVLIEISLSSLILPRRGKQCQIERHRFQGDREGRPYNTTTRLAKPIVRATLAVALERLLLLLRWQFLGIGYLWLVDLLLGLRVPVCLSALLVSPCRGRLISLLVRLVRFRLLFCRRLFWRVCLIRLLVLLRLPLVALRGGIDTQSHQTGCYGRDQRAQNG